MTSYYSRGVVACVAILFACVDARNYSLKGDRIENSSSRDFNGNTTDANFMSANIRVGDDVIRSFFAYYVIIILSGGMLLYCVLAHVTDKLQRSKDKVVYSVKAWKERNTYTYLMTFNCPLKRSIGKAPTLQVQIKGDGRTSSRYVICPRYYPAGRRIFSPGTSTNFIIDEHFPLGEMNEAFNMKEIHIKSISVGKTFEEWFLDDVRIHNLNTGTSILFPHRKCVYTDYNDRNTTRKFVLYSTKEKPDFKSLYWANLKRVYVLLNPITSLLSDNRHHSMSVKFITIGIVALQMACLILITTLFVKFNWGIGMKISNGDLKTIIWLIFLDFMFGGVFYSAMIFLRSSKGAVTYDSLIPVKVNEGYDHADMGCCNGFKEMREVDSKDDIEVPAIGKPCPTVLQSGNNQLYNDIIERKQKRNMKKYRYGEVTKGEQEECIPMLW